MSLRSHFFRTQAAFIGTYLVSAKKQSNKDPWRKRFWPTQVNCTRWSCFTKIRPNLKDSRKTQSKIRMLRFRLQVEHFELLSFTTHVTASWSPHIEMIRSKITNKKGVLECWLHGCVPGFHSKQRNLIRSKWSWCSVARSLYRSTHRTPNYSVQTDPPDEDFLARGREWEFEQRVTFVWTAEQQSRLFFSWFQELFDLLLSQLIAATNLLGVCMNLSPLSNCFVDSFPCGRLSLSVDGFFFGGGGGILA